MLGLKLKFMLKKSLLLSIFVGIAIVNSSYPQDNKFENIAGKLCMTGFVACLVCCMLGVKANLNISNRPAPTVPKKNSSNME